MISISPALLTGECGYDIPDLRNDKDVRNCAMAGDEYGGYLKQRLMVSMSS